MCDSAHRCPGYCGSGQVVVAAVRTAEYGAHQTGCYLKVGAHIFARSVRAVCKAAGHGHRIAADDAGKAELVVGDRGCVGCVIDLGDCAGQGD